MEKKGGRPRKGVNWNRLEEDNLSLLIWQQNIRQFWIDEEIPLSDDKNTWISLNREEKILYTRVLAGLTLLDTEQGSVGMPRISLAVESLHSKAVLSFMGMMEHMHAKSYSSIFSTLCTEDEIDELFNWAASENALQKKTEIILNNYNNIQDDKSLFMAMASSVLLETFLFYSGFFYPLFLSGSGKMVSSGEVINLIIRDESVHGTYVGLLARDLFDKFPVGTQHKLEEKVRNLAESLFFLEERYFRNLYRDLGLEKEVEVYCRYNCNKAFMNLGFEPFFNVKEVDINPIIIRGLETKTKNHDFFSVKGNSYVKAIRIEEINDDDFNV